MLRELYHPVAAANYVTRSMRQEREMLYEGKYEPILPTQAGLKILGKVYTERAKVMGLMSWWGLYGVAGIIDVAAATRFIASYL